MKTKKETYEKVIKEVKRVITLARDIDAINNRNAINSKICTSYICNVLDGLNDDIKYENKSFEDKDFYQYKELRDAIYDVLQDCGSTFNIYKGNKLNSNYTNSSYAYDMRIEFLDNFLKNYNDED
jgi:hypothetical protein